MPEHPSPSTVCPTQSLPVLLGVPYQHLHPVGTSARRRCRQSRSGCATEHPLSTHSLRRGWQGSGQSSSNAPCPMGTSPSTQHWSPTPWTLLLPPPSTWQGHGQLHTPSSRHLTDVLVVDRDEDIDGPLQPHECHAEQHQPLQQVVAPRPHVRHQQPQLPPEILPGGAGPAGIGQERLAESRVRGHCPGTPAQLATAPGNTPPRKTARSSQGPHSILPAELHPADSGQGAWAALNFTPPQFPEDADTRAAVPPFCPQLLPGHVPRLL